MKANFFNLKDRWLLKIGFLEIGIEENNIRTSEKWSQ
jgi:hypothetical protein